MFQNIVNRAAKLGAAGTLISTFLGGAVGHLLTSENVAAAIARMAETAANGPVLKGAIAAGVLAAFTKAVANAKPQ